MTDSEAQATPSLAVSHVVDFCRRHPGEPVTFFTRVDVLAPIPGFTLRIAVPDGLELGRSAASPNHGEEPSRLVFLQDERYLLWEVARDLTPGERFEYEFGAAIEQLASDVELTSRGLAIVLERSDQPETDEETVPAWADEVAVVSVQVASAYLRYLPAIYTEQDEFMGRFLSLFESFWEPISHQVDVIHHYFDPRMAPADLLPWLATWVNLTLDERWPEERRRELIRSAIALYRTRGTRIGLQRYLEIYTGQKAEIKEHRAHNFRLGREARLGASVALGRGNEPHTFTVSVGSPPAPPDVDDAERARLALDYRRQVESIIELAKPAHAGYTLIVKG